MSAYEKKGLSDPLELELQAVMFVWHVCWVLSLGSLKEQNMLLTTEPSSQPCYLVSLNLCECNFSSLAVLSLSLYSAILVIPILFRIFTYFWTQHKVNHLLFFLVLIYTSQCHVLQFPPCLWDNISFYMKTCLCYWDHVFPCLSWTITGYLCWFP